MNKLEKILFPKTVPHAPQAGDVAATQEMLQQFSSEITKLVSEGNALGARVRQMAVVVVYDDGEVYRHVAGDPCDYTLLLAGATLLQHQVFKELVGAEGKLGGELGLKPPLDREALECGSRGPSCFTRQQEINESKRRTGRKRSPTKNWEGEE